MAGGARGSGARRENVLSWFELQGVAAEAKSTGAIAVAGKDDVELAEKRLGNFLVDQAEKAAVADGSAVRGARRRRGGCLAARPEQSRLRAPRGRARCSRTTAR